MSVAIAEEIDKIKKEIDRLELYLDICRYHPVYSLDVVFTHKCQLRHKELIQLLKTKYDTNYQKN